MNTFLRMLAYTALLYFGLWISLRLMLYSGQHQQREMHQVPEFSRMKAKSAHHHGGIGIWQVQVVDEQGDGLYNLAGITNIVVKDVSGAKLRVFGNFPVPNKGEVIWLKAEFKQLRNHLFFPEGCGLMMIDMSFENLDETVAPATVGEPDD